MKIKPTTIMLIIIIALGFFLRVHGINYYSYGDEAYHVYNAIAIASGQMPTNFHPIALSLFYAFFYVTGWIFGIFATPTAFVETYFAHQHIFYFVGRLFDSIMGTASILLLYLLGKDMFSRKTGLIAALFLAVFPVAVEISQIARGQSLCLFLILTALYFSYCCLNKKKLIYFMVSGLAFGGAVSIRMPAGIIILPVLYFFYLSGILDRRPESGSRPGVFFLRRLKKFFLNPGLWFFILGGVIVFAGAYPWAILHLPAYLGSITSGISGTGIYLGSEVENGWLYYLTRGFPYALSWPLYGLFIVGLFFSPVGVGRKKTVVLAVLCVVYILIMGSAKIAAPRYLFPIFPACALLGAEFLGREGDFFKLRGRVAVTFFLTAAILFTFWPFSRVMVANREKLKPTTKNLAEDWIFRTLRPGTRIAVESMGYFGPDLKLTPVIDYWIYNLNKKDLEILLEERLAQRQPSYALKYFIEHPPQKKFYTDTISMRDIVDISSLLEARYEYIVITDVTGKIYANPQLKQRYPEYYNARHKFYRWLEEDGELIKTFKPDDNTPGSEIRVYKIRGEE